MAKGGKKAGSRKQKSVAPQKITKAVAARLKPIKGDARRRFRDPKTKKIYSRRQYEKFRLVPRVPRKNAPSISEKQQKYYTIRDIFIKVQKKKGKEYSKREAMASKKLQSIVNRLHSKNLAVRKKAFAELTAGNDKEWTPYIERWKKGEA